jgi:ADP-ribose pyrophosphatase YjhB (NUDIX family)
VEHRSDSDRWAFIGGRVRDDESLMTALRREVLEETGLEIERFQLFGLFSDPSRIIAYGDGHTVNLLTAVFRADVPGGAITTVSEESRELRFVTPDELRALRIAETHDPIRRRYLESPRDVVVD